MSKHYLRKCLQCGLEAITIDDLELFAKGNESKHGRQNLCKSCENKRKREHDRTIYLKEYNKKKRVEGCVKFKRTERNQQLKKNYGIRIEDYEKMFIDQNGLCKICLSDNGGKTLHVDHCHSTGKVRGLLCSKCNTALGLFNDNIKTLSNAIIYLTAQEVALA